MKQQVIDILTKHGLDMRGQLNQRQADRIVRMIELAREVGVDALFSDPDYRYTTPMVKDIVNKLV